jgi:putative transposase
MAEARKAMAEPGHKQISLSRQAKLLSINRTSFYRGPAASIWAEIDLSDMRIIDEIYTAKPFYGYRRITEEMQRGGRSINRKRVRRLMRIMGIAGICPGPNLSKLLHAKYVRPYLLRGLKITHPDQVWAVDITYVYE